jgi:UDP-N-acetylmuramyl pentapeptide phosphotransferase/UDP-N-acetylglucosamine-1-phosphate transferase
VIAILTAAAAGLVLSDALPAKLTYHAITVASAAIVLMLVGFADDIYGLPILPRLAVQAVAVGAVVLTLPPDLHAMPGHFSVAVERAVIFFAGIWFVNLYNFMDGLDLMSVTETVAISVGVLALSLLGLIPVWFGWVSAALIGGMLGFAPWNKPPAKLFLGDAGSLAIGLIVGTVLVHVAGAYALTAALILPLYYLMDASVTVIRRLVRVPRFWEPHRDHFYQMGTNNGHSVSQIIRKIALLDAGLVVLAVTAIFFRPSIAAVIVPLILAVFAVLLLLRTLSLPRE